MWDWIGHSLSWSIGAAVGSGLGRGSVGVSVGMTKRWWKRDWSGGCRSARYQSGNRLGRDITPPSRTEVTGRGLRGGWVGICWLSRPVCSPRPLLVPIMTDSANIARSTLTRARDVLSALNSQAGPTEEERGRIQGAMVS